MSSLHRLKSIFNRIVLLISTALLVTSCTSNTNNTSPIQTTGAIVAPLAPNVEAANQLFLNQKSFDAWNVGTTDPNRLIDPYLPDQGAGYLFGQDGKVKSTFIDGQYKNGVIIHEDQPSGPPTKVDGAGTYAQSLSFLTGDLVCRTPATTKVFPSAVAMKNWQQFWQQSDIAIVGDPEAQQVTHANMFYLAGSALGNQSIPPMGLSSLNYNGHIFWDAEIWMMPALIVQHPELAFGIIDYRFKRLKAAETLAKEHGFKGAEYPWESADTGMEAAPSGFDRERHITADIAFAAWQYYLWTGDKVTFESECWPIIKDNADYWVSRASKGTDGKYHINNLVGPDETADVINDDAWTNAIVATTLRDAMVAAIRVGQPADPKWKEVGSALFQAKDSTKAFYIEYPGMSENAKAKQADTQMLIYPLRYPMSVDCANKSLDYAMEHSISSGPAMTDSINAVDAALLGRSQQSLDLFHSSYRPFMRGPWDAFSEKRSTNNVYFCTGMGGCLQTVLYGFGGLQIVQSGQSGTGTLIAKGVDASLYAAAHLPPGWSELLIKGVEFQGHTYNVDVKAGAKTIVTELK